MGGAVGEFLEVSLGPLAPIEDWSRRPIARQQHRSLGWLKADAVKHGLHPRNHCLELILLGLHLHPEHLELHLRIILILYIKTTTC